MRSRDIFPISSTTTTALARVNVGLFFKKGLYAGSRTAARFMILLSGSSHCREESIPGRDSAPRCHRHCPPRIAVPRLRTFPPSSPSFPFDSRTCSVPFVPPHKLSRIRMTVSRGMQNVITDRSVRCGASLPIYLYSTQLPLIVLGALALSHWIFPALIGRPSDASP